MKNLVQLFTFLWLITTQVYAQYPGNPKSLEEAVEILDRETPDSLKTLVKQTPDRQLKKLVYPWAERFMTVFYWTNDRSDTSKIADYLEKRGIKYEKNAVILMAFKQYLNGRSIDKNIVFEPFMEQERKAAIEYDTRFIADSLKGSYIPKNLEETFEQIDQIWDDSVKVNFKELNPQVLSGYNLFGGRGFIDGWQLVSGSRLSRFFNDKGIYFPEDMSLIILSSYQRYLRKEDIGLEEQLAGIRIERENRKLRKIEYDRLQYSKYAVGDTVLFNFKQGFTGQEQELKYMDDRCPATGKVIDKDPEKLLIKVQLIESCDPKGIVIYDSSSRSLDVYMSQFGPDAEKVRKPKRRIVRTLKAGQAGWFANDDWAKKGAEY